MFELIMVIYMGTGSSAAASASTAIQTIGLFADAQKCEDARTALTGGVGITMIDSVPVMMKTQCVGGIVPPVSFANPPPVPPVNLTFEGTIKSSP